jgi:hypothetical protein
MSQLAKKIGIDPFVWYRIVGKQRATLSRVLLASALCREIVEDRRVWRLPRNTAQAVSMAAQCWFDQAENRIRMAIRESLGEVDIPIVSITQFEHDLYASAVFDLRLSAWVAMSYARAYLEAAWRKRVRLEEYIEIHMNDVRRFNPSYEMNRLFSDSYKVISIAERCVYTGVVGDEWDKIDSITRYFERDPQKILALKAVMECTAYALSALVINKAIDDGVLQRKTFEEELLNEGYVSITSADDGDAIIWPRNLGGSFYTELNLLALDNEQIEWIKASAIDAAARTFPIHRESASGIATSQGAAASLAVGVAVGAIAAFAARRT